MAFHAAAVGECVAAIVVAFVFVVFVVVPAVIRFSIRVGPGEASRWRSRVLLRYQGLSKDKRFSIITAHFVWVFAWFKLRLDPMFGELPAIFAEMPRIQSVMDIGCGYGVAGCALLELAPRVTILGIDPAPERARAAAAVFDDRGTAVRGGAPELDVPGISTAFDAVMVLDVIHFLSDAALEQTLEKVNARLKQGGRLVVRSIILPDGRESWAWRMAGLRRALTGGYACHRSVEKIAGMIRQNEFDVLKTEISGGNPELCWFIAERRRSERAEAGS